jgi:ATP-dependent helicase HrpB
MREPLPIDPLLPELMAALRGAGAAVLQAPPGAGKTTRVPPALLAAGLAGRGQVVVLEPRRVAARAAARRIAAEQGWRLGKEVGYQVRFERVASERTRILVVTEGVLLRRLQEDPLLEGVGAVVFDELHERSLEIDLGLALARRVQQEVRPDLVLLAMSATLEATAVAAYLGGCPVLSSPGRAHQVAVRWLGRPAPGRQAAVVAAAVRRALDEIAGDVLVFLPGMGEIRGAGAALEPLATERELDLRPLHGSLPAAEQDAALAPSPRRKVVLATNVAETSLTIPGVRAVVDTGLARVLRFDPGSGLDRLELAPVSRASAAQRAGRAGREAPGVCLRLWDEHEERARPAFEAPEVTRVDLAGAALQLLAWGERDLEAFPWLEAPASERLALARALLEGLGALADGSLTAAGRAMARLPVHPRLGRLLLEAHALGAPREGALLAALLAERDPFPGAEGDVPPLFSDTLARLESLAALAAGRGATATPWGRPRRGAAEHLLAAARQLERLVAGALGPSPSRRSGLDEALTRALLAAFPDRLARRRQEGGDRGLMVGGRGVRLAPSSGVRSPALFLCLDLDAGRRGERAEGWVRQASGVERAWLDPARLASRGEVRFDRERQRVVGVRRLLFADLAIEETEVPATPEAAAACLAAVAREDLAAALPLDAPPVASFLARVRALAAWRPELGLPPFDEEQLAALLPHLAHGRRTLAELRQAPLLDHLRGALSHAQLQALEREAPERLEVPSGSRIRLAYRDGEPPVLAARIQELFGLAETPRVAAGRVPVLLHLLAPNGRPQQVTDDLAGFWRRTYPEVRRELQGRYPKHALPDNPATAPAERRPRRR